ncbi:hypothetical protein ASG47_19995 [Devosia sp. Leaf420]|uniref:hypothetical protein n=1 Tax=Devosia sp. Leaf420 TaxID=1736374 RepID=UPI00071485A0|nr:hypothetical protein [Devosia sp. Leaf420]KQT50212.1 hypothetical protein ASG47_19995 [Devosia sp. Leaf420]
MIMLSDLVSVQRRFRRSVRIDADAGLGAGEGFICTPTAAQALRTTLDHIADHEHGAFTWTGAYGCGKSSLALVLATALGPQGKARKQALSTLPPDVVERFEKRMRWRAAGWTVVPIGGRRADPREVLDAAIDAAGIEPGDHPVERLLAAAAARPCGIVLLVDEMGKLLEHSAAGGGDAFIFQELAEAASRSAGKLVVVGILHQAFDDYAYRLARETRDDWLKIQGRFVDVPLSPAPDEQLGLLAAAISAPARKVDRAASAVASSIRSNDADAEAVAQTLSACWPIDPVVACLLGPLSRRRFGQNQRSLFGFLASSEPAGFQDFLRSTTEESQRLYDADWLWRYLRANLEPSILASPDGHRWSLAIDAVERSEARAASDDQMRLVTAVALIDMFRERTGLIASPEILAAALPDIPLARIVSDLEILSGWSVVVHRRHLGGYTLFAGSDFDIEGAIRDAHSGVVGCDYSRLRSTGVFAPILAKRHYHLTGSMRWFDVDVVSLEDAGQRVERFKGDTGAVGLFLLLINDSGFNARTLHRRVESLKHQIGDRPIAIGLSADSYMLREISMELIAVETVQSDRPELKGDQVARREIASRAARLGGELEERLRASLAATSWEVPELDAAALDFGPIEGAARLSMLASALADALFPKAPRLSNELVNRTKPSSNAMAATKALMVAMVDSRHEPNLGIEGYPPERGLYVSLLARTGLHAEHEGVSEFVTPPADMPHGLSALWERADALAEAAGPKGILFSDIYDAWRLRPYGVKDGLLPILALAYALSRQKDVSVYLDGAFCASIGDLFVDRLLQDPTCARIRRIDIDERHVRILHGISGVTGELLGEAVPGEVDPLSVSRRLVSLVTRTPTWVRRTQRLSPVAMRVRDLAVAAHDPNKFMLDDIPRLFAHMQDDQVVAELQSGLREIAGAYDAMLSKLGEEMLSELAAAPGADGLMRLHDRAVVVVGLTGNYRLDAFATRLRDFDGHRESIEGLASLAANKPPRDWVDRDMDAARMELAALAQEFLRAEGLAHVKGRPNGRVRMALYISDPGRPAIAAPDFSIDEVSRRRGTVLAEELRASIDARTPPQVVLAALMELGISFASALEAEGENSNGAAKRSGGAA